MTRGNLLAGVFTGKLDTTSCILCNTYHKAVNAYNKHYMLELYSFKENFYVKNQQNRKLSVHINQEICSPVPTCCKKNILLQLFME